MRLVLSLKSAVRQCSSCFLPNSKQLLHYAYIEFPKKFIRVLGVVGLVGVGMGASIRIESFQT